MSRWQHACRCLWVTTLLGTLAGPAEPADRVIYRCVEAGVATFSDRPCGSSAEVYSYEVRSYDVSNPAATGATVPSKPATNSKAASRQRPRKTRAENRNSTGEADCKRIQARLKQLSARMRAGYGVAEGERLRDQQRAARARSRELRCR